MNEDLFAAGQWSDETESLFVIPGRDFSFYSHGLFSEFSLSPLNCFARVPVFCPRRLNGKSNASFVREICVEQLCIVMHSGANQATNAPVTS